MHRIRVAFAVTFVLLMLAAPAVAAVGDAPRLAAQTDVEDVEDEDRSGPAVLVEEDVAAPEEDAWTFRYLIPTLLGATGLAVAAVVIGYGVRVRARYRVVE